MALERLFKNQGVVQNLHECFVARVGRAVGDLYGGVEKTGGITWNLSPFQRKVGG